MISSQDRFFSDEQIYFGSFDDPKAEVECSVWDWDQLRMIKVKGTAKLLPLEGDVEVSILARIADYLSPEVREITVDDDGLLIKTSTDPKEDTFYLVPYLPFELVKPLLPPDRPTIKRSQLQENDRLGPGVDRSSYEDNSGRTRQVAFKFNPMSKPLRLRMNWDEMNLLSCLPDHPNIVPFDQIVLDDVESRILGFTTKYIPGGTLANSKAPFQFEWLQQLTQLVDYLNLELGIIHQDIAPRNLLLDPATNKLLLFDFDRAVRVSDKEALANGRDDVSGVAFTIYELVTNDTRLSGVPHWDRTIDIVQNIDWPCNRELDSDVSTFRDYLNEWVAKRKSGSEHSHISAPRQITWPEMPIAPDYSVPFKLGEQNGEPIWQTGSRSNYTALENGQFVFRWERPPQSRLLPKR